MSKTSSQLVTAFVETKQNLELDRERHRFAAFEETIKNRASRVKGKVEEEVSFNKAIQLAEKFKLMEDHKIDLPAFERKYGTDLKAGLTTEEAERRLA
jgi:hypothetical protein